MTGFEELILSMRNDEKDRHVVAAAVKAGAQVIVTFNRRDFYDLPSGIEVQTPDVFLSNLFDLDPARMLSVLVEISRRYSRPPKEISEILEALNLREFGRLIRAQLEAEVEVY